ncbi:MAG: helix-turn-helix domain-containing protein [Lachnospiraceae bacterium]|nr:helix-turn-helix domain-containing protein [Lachnospiraceae bacterium]
MRSILTFALFLFNMSAGSFYIDSFSGYDGFWYYIKEAFMASGFLAYALSSRLIPGERIKKGLLMLCNILFTGGIICLNFVSSITTIHLLAVISMFGLGYIGGAVYYYAAAGLFLDRREGLFMALGAAAANLLQFAVQTVLNVVPVLIISLATSFLVISALVIKPPKDWVFGGVLPYEKPEDSAGDNKKAFAVLVIALSLAMLCNGRLNMLQLLDYSENAAAYSGMARLFIIPAYFLAGFIFDRGKRHELYLSLLCSMVICAMLPAAFIKKEYAFCFLIFLENFNIACVTILFWAEAPKTGFAELWASFGRLVMAAEGILGAALIGFFRPESLSDLLFGILLVIFSVAAVGEILRNMTTSKETSDEGADRFQMMSEQYRFTPREEDVVRTIAAMPEATGAELAEALGISRTMLYRYLNQLYEKTGTTEKKELVSLIRGGI